MATVRLELTATPAQVRTARLVAAAVARRCGVDESLLDEIRLAVGEACSRAVGLHRQQGRRELVRLELDDGGPFAVEVHDVAGPERTPPGGAGARSYAAVTGPDEALGAGVGLALLSELVDDVDVRPTADGRGTVVRMSWPMAAVPRRR